MKNADALGKYQTDALRYIDEELHAIHYADPLWFVLLYNSG